MNVRKLLSSILGLCLLSGCVYKMEVQQGNLITEDQTEKLTLGMSEDEVRALLGTPLLEDPFSPGRWDYVYQLQEEGELVEQHRLTVFFEEGHLKRVEGSSVDFSPEVVEHS